MQNEPSGTEKAEKRERNVALLIGGALLFGVIMAFFSNWLAGLVQ